ncbi:Inositol monophosphatase, putative [Pediculus humanus corporis]|uniref:Inositol-1-monophosphatase n=1 Tax=Pediculus humanus subsp. corporis TaxID=121224 RepID=E0W1C9_PEDHC|nr:Inositol monophosphatase, putative [Pediculus humanus corporis]EEB19435.1 Inositol monophosphatase, putative [Pediculus humanus corporis]
MSAKEIKEYFEFVKTIILQAGEIVTEGFYKDDKNVEIKNESIFDLVTMYDKKVEELFTNNLKTRYPSHKIIGEETWPTGQEIKLTDEPTWIIDPIDGTTNYAKNIPLIGISVALAIKKNVVIGIVYNPILNQFYSAIKGEGSYYNGKRIYSTKNEDLQKSVVSNEISLASIPRLHERTMKRIKSLTKFDIFCNSFRSLGSAAITLCYLADGKIDVYFTDGLKCWDIAAGILILQEAGGCACCSNGEPYDMFSKTLVAAGNEALLKEIVKHLKECDD